MEVKGQGERVVVTGMGTVNALAADTRGFGEALRQGACGIGPITLFDTTGFRTHNGAQVKDFPFRTRIPRDHTLRRTSRADRFALAAACEALDQAGLLPVPEGLREEMGVVIGGGAGGLLEAEAFFQEYLRRGGTEITVFPPRPGLLRHVGEPSGDKIQPLGTQDHPDDGLLLRGHGHRPRKGPDPDRCGPGHDRGRHGAPLPDDVRLI